jgi:glutamate dehydrogenase
MNEALVRTGPVIEMYDVPGSREKRLIIGFKNLSTRSFFSAMSDLYHFYHLYTTRKYVENFSSGVTIMSFYLNQMPNTKATPIESSIFQIIKEASLLYCIPTTPFQQFFQKGILSVQEATYANVGWIFAQHFLNRLGSEFKALSSVVDMNNTSNHFYKNSSYGSVIQN